MNILLVSGKIGWSKTVSVGHSVAVTMMVFLLGVVPLVSGYLGYRIAQPDPALQSAMLSNAWSSEMAVQREEINEAKLVAEENLNALTLRLGQMQAHVIRLDALGQRLTQMAGLDSGEFDFSQVPAQGGPVDSSSLSAIQVPDFVVQLETLASQVNDREQQLDLLESMLRNRYLSAEVLPAGRPITKGWLSSKFGMRTDPFTGKQELHKGVDFAGKMDSDVIAVASGVVTWSDKRYGYGNMIEINHGKGFVTRYGHNKELLVKIGDTIKKGQSIALMGSTGRSTGPHVHFEVWRDGRTVDPMRYIVAAR